MIASHIATVLNEALRGGRCAIALAGGHTPRAVYADLAREYGPLIDWTRVHVFFGDERFVPATSSESNYAMARESLLDHIRIPVQNVHPIRTDLPTPEAAADDYEEQLRQFFGDALPRFDLILLGMGADGHTASLFPHAAALRETRRRVVATTAPTEPRDRITLTLPVINNAAHIAFLIGGQGKEAALAKVRSGRVKSDDYPAAAVKPVHGVLRWFVEMT